jgi:hypothetical protein
MLRNGQNPESVQGVFTIAEWCQAAKISPALFYKEQRLGRGPRVAKVGRRTAIIESPFDYLARRRSFDGPDEK